MDTKKKTVKKSASIADSLSERQSSIKRKFQKLKAKKISEKLEEVQSAPKINKMSRKLALKSQPEILHTENRIRRTHAILKKSKLMPKKVKLNINQLKTVPVTKNCTPVKYDMIFTCPKSETPVTFPSVKCLTGLNTPAELEIIPDDIFKRNVLWKDLKTQGETEKNQEPEYLNLPIQERSKVWAKKKKQKIKLIRKERLLLEKEDCTFRPTFFSTLTTMQTSLRGSTKLSNYSKKQRTQSQASVRSGRVSSCSSNRDEDSARVLRQFSRTGSSSIALNKICPVPVDVSYYSGISNGMRKKSKPLISYGILNVRP